MKRTVTITKEETKYERIKITKKVSMPIYVKDEYGYLLGCFDGKTTVQIGLNGIQVNDKYSHSIETHKYISDRFISDKSKQISEEEFINALSMVGDYVANVSNRIIRAKECDASKAK